MDFSTPDQITEEYLANLKSLKPEVNRDQLDSDWYVRGLVVGGVVSGVYQDNKKISNDAFPQSARHEALGKHLFLYLDRDFLPATESDGSVAITGTSGSTFLTGGQFLHQPTGNIYEATQDVTLVGPTGEVPVISIDSGQDQNLISGTSLVISTPPAGIDSAATVLKAISDGKDSETDGEASAAVLSFIQSTPRGGDEADYEAWAKEADPSVSSASIARFLFGFGSVGVYITAGTSNIDEAIDQGSAIVRIPSDALIAKVLAYIDALNPVTDCVSVLAPTEINQDVTIDVTYAPGFHGTDVLAGQTLTLNEIVQREISRVLYKLPTGGRKIAGSGYVVAAEIEEQIDVALGDTPYSTGTIATVIIDRQVHNLDGSNINRLLTAEQIVKPGTLTVNETDG